MAETLRAGVIGMGIGLAHARGYAAAEGVDLVAVCDSDPLRLKLRAAEYAKPDSGVAFFTDAQEMFAQANLDVVSLCIPNALHVNLVEAALEAGLHVVCEKPLAPTLAGAEQIVKLVKGAPTKFTVCYDKRYRVDTLWLKEAVDAGTLGDIYSVEARWTRETGIPGGWFSNKALAGGGPLIDLGVHMLDTALWALGFPQVETVSGSTRSVFGPQQRKVWTSRGRPKADYEVEDGAFGFLRLAGGIPLFLEASWADHRRPGEDDMYWRIAGSKGAVEVAIPNYTEQNTVTLYTEVNGTAVAARPNLHTDALTGHGGLIQRFVDSIHNDTEPPAPVEQGLVTVQVLDALYRSAAAGREIVL